MGQLPENNAGQDNPSAAIALTSLGVMLREAREQLGLSVADVAAQIKFAPRQIEALEADDFKNLPETAFLRGFVRSYAKILNVDAEIFLAALPQAKAQAAELIPASVEVPFPVAHSSQRQNLILLGAALLLAVIVAGFAVWHFTAPVKQAKVEKIETPLPLPAEMQIIPAPPVAQDSKIEPAIPDEPKRRASVTADKSPPRAKQAEADQSALKIQSAVSATQHTATMKTAAIHLVFDEEAWAEITDKDGKIISSRVHPPGSEMNLRGHLPLTLVIGHAAATHLYRDGKPVDLAPFTNSTSEVARITLE